MFCRPQGCGIFPLGWDYFPFVFICQSHSIDVIKDTRMIQKSSVSKWWLLPVISELKAAKAFVLSICQRIAYHCFLCILVTVHTNNQSPLIYVVCVFYWNWMTHTHCNGDSSWMVRQITTNSNVLYHWSIEDSNYVPFYYLQALSIFARIICCEWTPKTSLTSSTKAKDWTKRP